MKDEPEGISFSMVKVKVYCTSMSFLLFLSIDMTALVKRAATGNGKSGYRYIPLVSFRLLTTLKSKVPAKELTILGQRTGSSLINTSLGHKSLRSDRNTLKRCQFNDYCVVSWDRIARIWKFVDVALGRLIMPYKAGVICRELEDHFLVAVHRGSRIHVKLEIEIVINLAIIQSVEGRCWIDGTIVRCG